MKHIFFCVCKGDLEFVKLCTAQFLQWRAISSKTEQTWRPGLLTSSPVRTRSGKKRRRIMRSQVITSQRLHLVISKIDLCTILQKRQLLTTKNTTTKSSVCIWRLVKLIAAQFCKKSISHDEVITSQRLQLVISKIDRCTILQKRSICHDADYND